MSEREWKSLRPLMTSVRCLIFVRRKNLAVHLGLDEKVSKKEVQKINTFSLPVPSSATSFDLPDSALKDIIVVEDKAGEAEEEEERIK